MVMLFDLTYNKFFKFRKKDGFFVVFLYKNMKIKKQLLSESNCKKGMRMLKVVQKTELQAYNLGDQEKRPWGSYKVIGVGTDENGEEYCQKEITVEAGHILSLQSHNHRRETWTVKKGVLTVVLEDKRFTLKEGESINIPLQAIHCMANGGPGECIIHEKQIGLCSEDDIIRYVDAYGRSTLKLDARSQASADLFNIVKAEISQKN